MNVTVKEETRLEKFFTFLGRCLCALAWLVPLALMAAAVIWLLSFL
jgi:hypothetical protein